jgi:site-specific recombinase XerD
MTPADLAGVLEMVAQALRLLPAGALQLPVAQAAAPVVAPPAAPAPAARTLGDWLDVHEGILLGRNYKPQTIKNRRSNLAHVRRLWGDVSITELRPHAIATALKTFPKARSSTAGRVLAELRDAYVEAVANGWCESNPARDIKPPKHKVMRERLELDVWMQMRTLAQASPQRWVESMLLLALVIGQRRADLAKVRFDDVVDGHLRVEQQKEAGKGYGARVEIPLTLRMECIDMTVGDVIEHCRQSAKPGPTLLRKAGGGAIEMSSLSARFCETIKAVLGPNDPGTHKRPSLHETRSLSARTYVAQGLDPRVVQTLLGHSDIEMTELYLHERGLAAHKWKRVVVPAGDTDAAQLEAPTVRQ